MGARELAAAPTFTPEELQRCIDLLERLAADRALLAGVDREERVRLLAAAGRLSRPTRDEQRRMARAFRSKDRAEARAHDRELTATTEIRAARRAEVYVAPPRLVPAVGAEERERELREPRDCYVCKAPYRKVHFFYDAMCPACAELNYAKRFQRASLAGRTALITGARIKIGFQAALMMLRAGARVLVTTRFPRDAAARFAREADFAELKDRLQIFGLDLRHAPSVEIFARYVTQTEPRLDVLINNAAQTVRRPAAFYAHLLELERKPHHDLPSSMRDVLASHEECKAALTVAPEEKGSPAGFVAWSGGGPGVGIAASAMLSQLPCAYDDAARNAELFPAGRSDADRQQIDLRTTNSWRLTLAEVPSPEMLEVQLVNAVAPFILCSKLKPLMTRDRTDEKHVVNVSAMEGQFSRRTKTDKHPHTNMAKAALNMMTLTSAPDYAAAGIFMNAVDTGWVTDEDPVAHSQRKQAELDFQPPLDIVDGAARVCDPLFSGLLAGRHAWGKFFKDYREAEW
jgi:NAD(P)-dependent dehydrogenase (short-subunit alcohol dehydrogenase family)